MTARVRLSRGMHLGVALMATFASVALFLISPFAVTTVEAQRRVPLSQHGTVSQTVDQTVITVEYFRPQARGRQIFGEGSQIVVDGRVWDMGANRATSIEFSDDVILAGQELPAGKYSIWAIPHSDGPWGFVVNTEWDVFHIPYPGEETEVFRTEIMPEEGAFIEVLTFYFPVVGPDHATLNMHWGTTVLPIPIELAGGE